MRQITRELGGQLGFGSDVPGKLKKKRLDEMRTNLRQELKAQTASQEEHQEKLYQLQKKRLEDMQRQIDEIKACVEKEFNRRDDWKKIPEEIRRVAKDRKVWVIKCPATEGDAKYRWGDYYYAVALKKYLERKGVYVLVDLRQDWGCEAEADVVLVLRGKYFYRPDRRNQKCLYIMWNISHPDMVSEYEYELYDVVCTGSRYYASVLKEKLKVPVVPLLQCTDTELFCHGDGAEPENSGAPENRYKGEYIFIGSTRGIMRNCVLWAAQEKLPLHVWGSGWNRLLPEYPSVVEGTFMENERLPQLYRSAKATLNDHWQDMLDTQIINNRVFDALACGLPVISDGCAEMKEIFPDAVLYYSNKEEFDACVKKLEQDYDAVKARAMAQFGMIQKDYSFERRAEELLEIAEKYR